MNELMRGRLGFIDLYTPGFTMFRHLDIGNHETWKCWQDSIDIPLPPSST